MRATLRGFVSDSKCHNLSRFKCVTWVISFVISRQTLVIYLHFNEKWSFLKIWILLHLDIFHTKIFWAKNVIFYKKRSGGGFRVLIEKMSFKNYLIRSDENWVLPYFLSKTFSKIQNSLKIRINYDFNNLATIWSL